MALRRSSVATSILLFRHHRQTRENSSRSRNKFHFLDERQEAFDWQDRRESTKKVQGRGVHGLSRLDAARINDQLTELLFSWVKRCTHLSHF